MSEDILNSDAPLNTEPTKDELLEDLKNIARSKGVKFHPSIGYEKLQAKMAEHRSEEEKKARTVQVKNQSPELQMELAKQSVSTPSGGMSISQQRKHQLELVRVRVNPLNTHMNGLKGQNFTVSNGLVGTVTKYVPFNSPYGWHIPRCLYEELETKQYQVFREVKLPSGKTVTRNELAKAYAIEVMAPLNPDEIRSIQENIRSTDGQEDY